MLIDELRSRDYLYALAVEPLIDPFFNQLNRDDLPRMEISNIAEFMASDPGRHQSFSECIPCAIAPFPTTWVEFKTFPGWPHYEGITNHIKHVGGLVTLFDLRKQEFSEKRRIVDPQGALPESRFESIEAADWFLDGHFSILRGDGQICLLGWNGQFLLNADGAVIKPAMGRMHSDHVLSDDERREAAIIAIQILSVAGLAFSFTHCKNVTRIVNAPSKNQQKANRRAGLPPPAKYYTLQIDPMKKVLRTEGRSDEVGLQRALHICRGHFANYSEDKPLFGRVAGRFWIPAHVRGSKDAGEVKKDYKVNAVSN